MRHPAHLTPDELLKDLNVGEAVVLGLMSGSSLDGVDLCLARIGYGPQRPWAYRILFARTLPYPAELQERLRQASQGTRVDLSNLDVELGQWWGREILGFLDSFRSSGGEDVPLLLASHGHTVDHNPQRGYTYQIGHPAWLHTLTGLPVIHDFRSADVALGGQGAPLVPMGDALLFGNYQACLNLGGIANLSWEENGVRRACDLTFCNTALNRFAQRAGMAMDRDGILSQNGRLLPEVLQAWDAAPWYRETGARSLDTATFEQQFEPVTLAGDYAPADLCYTWCEHSARVLAQALNACSDGSDTGKNGQILVSGGGAAHPVLLRSLAQKTIWTPLVADSELRDFKEALIFGLLGLLHTLDLPNVLGSGTGAPFHHRSGSRMG